MSLSRIGGCGMASVPARSNLSPLVAVNICRHPLSPPYGDHPPPTPVLCKRCSAAPAWEEGGHWFKACLRVECEINQAVSLRPVKGRVRSEGGGRRTSRCRRRGRGGRVRDLTVYFHWCGCGGQGRGTRIFGMTTPQGSAGGGQLLLPPPSRSQARSYLPLYPRLHYAHAIAL